MMRTMELNSTIFSFLPVGELIHVNGILNIALSGVLVTLALLLYFFQTRNKRKEKKRKKELEEHEWFTNTLLDSVSVGFVFLTQDQIIEQANKQALIELKVEKKEITGKNTQEILMITHDNVNILPQFLTRVQAGELEIEFPPNTFITNRLKNISFLAKGHLKRIHSETGQLRMILSFRNVVAELTQEYVLNMALSRTKIFPWSYDLDRHLMIIDRRYFEYLGVPPGDCTLTNEQFAQMVHPDDIDGVIQALTLQLQGNYIEASVSYRLRRGDGSWEWFEAQSTYLGQGTPTPTPFRVVGVCLSTQEHKTIEEELIRARNKAQQGDRLKSAFLANMSHEIRTPLNAIVGFSNLLVDDSMEFGKDELKEYLSLINVNCEQLLVLISDILDLSKIESNSMVFNISRQSLNLLLQDIFQAQKLNMPSGVGLILDIPPDDITIQTDPNRLKQVINNLINNAVKFTLKGHISFGYRQEGSLVIFHVKDTGTGISEEKIGHIFERFYKGDNFVQGTGLGLAICQTIVEHFKGSISVTSKLEEGSCFTIKLPVQLKVKN